jgi:proton-translocating NADH-quinone oxidoreductase chain N
MGMPYFLWIIALPVLISPVVYLLGRLGAEERFGRISQAVALGGLLVAWVPFALAARHMGVSGPAQWSLGEISLTFDGLALLLAAVALGMGTLVVLYSGPYLSGELGQEKYYAMILAMVGMMIGLGAADDLFNLWIWFEAMAVCSYLLVTFYREQPASLEAGFKYLVQSTVGSALILVAVGIVFSATGSLRLEDLRSAAWAPHTMLAAGALFVVGFGVKAALVPLHTWLPDAHSQAPSGISAMLSGIVIEAGLVAMLKSLSALAVPAITWGSLLLGFGALNMLVGNLMALRQQQVKRLLAYSSLAHMGYMLVGIGIAISGGKVDGAQGGLFHLLNHGLMKGLAFLAAGSMLYSLHLGLGDHSPLTIDDLAGAARRYPLAAMALSIAVLGLGGLPPMAGFMSKWQIFAAGFRSQSTLIGGLIVFAALNSVLSLAYYAPLVNAVYRGRPSPAVEHGRPLPASMEIPLLILGVAIVLVGIWPSLTNWLTYPAGSALLAAFGQG